MSTHKHINQIICVVLAVTLSLTIFFMNAQQFGIAKSGSGIGYENRLFNPSSVHTIDIVMDDWDSFIGTCTNEAYSACTVIIDGDAYKNVGIRAKGNTSLTRVASYGNNRYSFKIEFGHYDNTKTYYGLDKLCLNNIIQDNTYMKDYLTYQMMAEMGVASPLCSYANITVNGEAWGLYLAVEGIEASFLKRNFGNDYGTLYKPDSMNMGGGRGNGKNFDMEQLDRFDSRMQERQMHGFQASGSGIQAEERQDGKGQHGLTRGSDDVLLKYIDDEITSYPNIFDNAKTDSSDNDKQRLIASLKKLNRGETLENAVDTDRVIRYFVVHNFVLNFDSYTGSLIHNYYLSEKDGQLSMLPWDYNLAFGGFESETDAANLVNYPIDSPVSGGNTEDRPMLSWIFADEAYTKQYHQCFAEFLSDYFDSGRFATLVDSVKTLISPYVKQDPTKFCTYEEFVNGADTLKEFCLLRAESIRCQLDGSIGLTSAGQNRESFIDAGNINISDMGSSGHSGVGRTDNKMQLPNHTDTDTDNKTPNLPDNRMDNNLPNQTNGRTDSNLPNQTNDRTDNNISNPPDDRTDSNLTNPPDGRTDSNISNPPDDRMDTQVQDTMHRPDRNGMDKDMKHMGDITEPTDAISPSAWILTGISFAAIILGLVFAFFFKRRR